jgi:hypothetical protein
VAAQAGMNTGTLAETVAASGIANFIIPTPAASPLFDALAWQKDVSGIKSGVYDVPSWDAFPSASNQTEADEFALSNFTTGKKSFTAVDPGLRALITDQVVQDSTLMQSDMVDQMAAALRDHLDKQVLNLFVAATNVSDNSDVNLSLALLQSSLASFKAQKPRGAICFVGSNNQIRDLLLALQTAAASPFLQGSGNEVFNSENVDGYRGKWGGIHVFESANIQQADADNDAGGFVAVTAAAAGSELAAPSLSGLGLAIWAKIEAKGVYVPSRKGFDVTCSARVGYQRVAEYLCRSFFSKKTAA